MFQFPGFASCTYEFSAGYSRSCGLPHSEIRGSKVIRTSPRLIAAYHVLHRLSAPRHPPNALKSLDRSHYQCPSLKHCRPNSVIGLQQMAIATAPSSSLLRPEGRKGFSGKHRQKDQLQDLSVGSAVRPCPFPPAKGELNSPNPANQTNLYLLHDVIEPAHEGSDGHLAINGTFMGKLALKVASSSAPHRWWSQTGSNRRPPACKAGALPTELWPPIRCHVQRPGKGQKLSACPACPPTQTTEWWAWVDSNYRPHAYQACALTT